MRTIFIGLSLLAASCVMREQPKIFIGEGGCPIKKVYSDWISVYDCDFNLVDSYGYDPDDKGMDYFLRNKYIYQNGKLIENQEWSDEDTASLCDYKAVYLYKGDFIYNVCHYEKKVLNDSAFLVLREIEDWENNKYIRFQDPADSIKVIDLRTPMEFDPTPPKFRGR